MGMRPGQVVRSALWQATTIAVVAAAIGIPLGIVAGRWSWVVLAGGLGVVAEPTVPALVIVGVGAAVLLIALRGRFRAGIAVVPPSSRGGAEDGVMDGAWYRDHNRLRSEGAMASDSGE